MLPASHILPCLGERVTSGLPDAGCRSVRCRSWRALTPANVKDPGGEMSADYDPGVLMRGSRGREPLAASAHILPPAASGAPADLPWVRFERNMSAFEHPGGDDEMLCATGQGQIPSWGRAEL